MPRELPNTLAVLGGGAIGVELGQAFARLGSKVTVIEAGPRFLGLEEPEAGAALRPHLEADGINVDVLDVRDNGATVHLTGVCCLSAAAPLSLRTVLEDVLRADIEGFGELRLTIN